MRIRPAERGDCESVMLVHVSAIIEHGPKAYDDRQVAAWAAKTEGVARYERAIEEPTTDLLVAEIDSEIAGFAELDRDGPEIKALFVAPAHGGSGVGTALLEECETRLQSLGAETSRLEAVLNAVGFYEAAGYEPVERVTNTTTADVEVESMKMRKPLD
ncbi:GNAT family N-acetyltransferase [Natronomonas halophila]|uniref:GNAT family N-acetyltransferase n=1 Tax=Natronomonas halophila TaxID=2747817 RepID=UPI0015B4318B|nr:GNAT family N-acetyltransferase [Natronomonas halophila]QLD85316.1 GNAT family N-acetyltransferase [Natronomonas halophila]